jgi:uncharacterized protein (DUF1501 family)
VAQSLSSAEPASSRAIDAVVLGGTPGPARGQSLRTVVLNQPRRLLRKARPLPPMPDAPPNATPALRHILRTAARAERANARLRAVLDGTQPASGFPRFPFGRQLATAAQLLEGGLAPPVIKVQLKGFDTHAGQVKRHRRLLDHLATALSAFRARLRETGHWSKVLVITYAEFGRRVRENGSAGTDHGAAAPHFVLGGRVRGGLYGAPPSLTELEGRDLRHTTDFRRLYATANQFWGHRTGAHRPLDLLR